MAPMAKKAKHCELCLISKKTAQLSTSNTTGVAQPCPGPSIHSQIVRGLHSLVHSFIPRLLGSASLAPDPARSSWLHA